MIEREPESGLREVVHQRVRLGVLAVLDRQGPCTFPQLREALGQSDGGLGRHLGVLEDHGYIATEKVFENRRPRTWVRLTDTGAEAFREEQELLAKLLARADHDSAGSGSDGRTASMTIVFAALLAGEDGGTDDDRSGADRIDHSGLVPVAPDLPDGRRVELVASGAISPRYDFPAVYADFGQEQREQRLMMISHGLRGGWITTWHADGDGDDGGRGAATAHAMVLELGSAADCDAILTTMSPGTVSLPGAPDARAHLLPGSGTGSDTALAWSSSGPFLALVVVVANAGLAVPALDHLVVEVHAALAADRS